MNPPAPVTQTVWPWPEVQLAVLSPPMFAMQECSISLLICPKVTRCLICSGGYMGSMWRLRYCSGPNGMGTAA
jgi:hypothetical protein